MLVGSHCPDLEASEIPSGGEAVPIAPPNGMDELGISRNRKRALTWEYIANSGGGAGNRTPVRRYFGGGLSERSRWRAFRRSDSIGE